MNHKPLNHKRQKYRFSCGACAFSIIMNIDEDHAIKLCKTNKSGTDYRDVMDAFKKLNVIPHLANINEDFFNCWWLENLKFPVYVSGFFKTKFYKKGRPRQRHHAFVVYDKKIYDPSEDIPFPIEAYNHIFDSLVIERIIIAEKC